jgi:hypothetical protein
MYYTYLLLLAIFQTIVTQRGEHNIEREFMYPMAQGLVFHDSCGFESGSEDELKKVREFITKRTKQKQLTDQLHAIWYSLEFVNFAHTLRFFLGTVFRRTAIGHLRMKRWVYSMKALETVGVFCLVSHIGFDHWYALVEVPVIVVFTKLDTLDHKAFNTLIAEGKPISQARQEAPALAASMFEEEYFKELNKKAKYQPSQVVQLRSKYTFCKWHRLLILDTDMHLPESNCDVLLESTAQAIDPTALKLLFRLLQRNNLGAHIKHAIKEWVTFMWYCT